MGFRADAVTGLNKKEKSNGSSCIKCGIANAIDELDQEGLDKLFNELARRNAQALEESLLTK